MIVVDGVHIGIYLEIINIDRSWVIIIRVDTDIIGTGINEYATG